MLDTINIERSTPSKYYRYEEPASTTPPANSRLYAYDYRTFLIVRKDWEFHFWQIQMADETDPPLPLQGNYTTKERAERAVDEFIEIEFSKQKAHDNNRA